MPNYDQVKLTLRCSPKQRDEIAVLARERGLSLNAFIIEKLLDTKPDGCSDDQWKRICEIALHKGMKPHQLVLSSALGLNSAGDPELILQRIDEVCDAIENHTEAIQKIETPASALKSIADDVKKLLSFSRFFFMFCQDWYRHHDKKDWIEPRVKRAFEYRGEDNS